MRIAGSHEIDAPASHLMNSRTSVGEKADMMERLSRRSVVKSSVRLTALGALGMAHVPTAPAREAPPPGLRTFSDVDAMLASATSAAVVPGIVAYVANETDIVYEGAFGTRRLHTGPAMTKDTVFRVASMVKPMTSVAALQLIEQGKLALDAPAPDVDPAIGSPQVLEGFDAAGKPQLRPASRPITLRHLLTHTAGFTYRLWDAKAVRYRKSIESLPAAERKQAPSTPLMFEPGERWQYGTSIDWVGRIVEHVGGEPIDVYLRKHILAPLGMKDTAFIISKEQRAREASVHKREPDGSLKPEPIERPSPPGRFFNGGGGIYSTGPDYLTFVRMLLAGGSLNGVRILAPDTVARMGRNQIGDIAAGILKTTTPQVSNDVDFFPGTGLRWGLGHMINMQAVPHGRSAGSLTWAGLFNTYYWIDPEKRVAAVFFTQVLPFADERALRIYRQFERGVYESLKAV
jgi:CubicO group peptidase (beta-lactamase class C family)